MRWRGLLYVALVLFISPLAHASSCEVVTQSAGEKSTSAVCQILESEYLGADADQPRTGVVMQLAWLQPQERRDLPMLLGYLSTLGLKTTLELPSTRYNDEPMALLAAHGGAVLEREQSEPVGVTRSIAEAFATGGGDYLLLDDFVPHADGNVRRRFSVPTASPRILITVFLTDPTGSVVVKNPSGGALNPTRRTAKALQWDLTAPAAGEWTVEVARTLRTRMYVQTPAAGEAPRIRHCHQSGAVTIDGFPAGSWRIDRANADGLRFVSQGHAGTAPRISENGNYALTLRTPEGRIHRLGIHAGPTRAILYRPTPSGIVAGETEISCALLGMNLGATVTAHIGDVPAAATITPSGVSDGISSAEVRVTAPAALSEGPQTIEVTPSGEGGDSWSFVMESRRSSVLRISEIHPTQGWLEIEAVAAIEDLSEFGLTDLESGPVSLPERRLDVGERMVVQYERPQIGTRMFGVPLRREVEVSGRDQIAIVRQEGEDFAVLDAVVLDDGTETKWSDAEKADLELLAARGEWAGEAVRWAGAHASLGRAGTSDANGPADWHPYYYPTPGAANVGDPVLESLAAGAVVFSEIGVWDLAGGWAEIEVRNGPVDIAALSLSDMDGVDFRLGESPRILPSGARVLLRFGRPAGDGEIRLPREASPGDEADQAVLLLGERVIDVVSWRTAGEELSRDEAKDMARLADPPVARPSLVSGIPHPSLSRVSGSWQWTYAPTPGAANMLPPEPAQGSVRLAAVSPSEFDGDWAEIVCLAGPVDVSRFILTDIDGVDAALAEAPVTLASGERVVVHWIDGTDEVDGVGDANGNGVRDLYLGARDALSSTDDQLALVWGGKIYDAVIFTNGDGTMSRDEQKDFAYLLAAGHWSGSVSQNDAVNVGTYRLPVERIDPTQDTNGKGDWRSRTPPANQ